MGRREARWNLVERFRTCIHLPGLCAVTGQEDSYLALQQNVVLMALFGLINGGTPAASLI